MEEIKQLIGKYIQNNKYITCLEEVYLLFEKNKVTFEERNIIMQEIYKYNSKIHSLEQRKSGELKKIVVSEKINVETNNVSMIRNDLEVVENSKIESLDCNVDSYFSEVKKINSIEDLEILLPSRENEHFENIINMLLIKLYQEKVEIVNLIHEQQTNEPNVQYYFEEDLDQIEFIMDLLSEYKNYTEEDIIEEESKNNRIVFLKNSSNEPMIISSLKGYEEYYESFLELLNNILEGNFKRSRNFSNNNKIVDLLEVKSFKTRIIFSGLKDNIIVVMPAFVKKCDTDLRHRHLIENISRVYQQQKEELLKLTENEEFMEQEEKYLKDIIEMLKEKKKVNVK